MPKVMLIWMSFVGLLPLLAACGSTPEQDPVVATEPPETQAVVEEKAAPGEEIPEQTLLDPNRIVARVNDEIITVRTILARPGVSEAIEALGERSEQQLSLILDREALNILVERLQLEAAKRLGIEVSPEQMRRAIAKEEKDAKARGTTFMEDLKARGIAMWEWEDRKKKEIISQMYTEMLRGRAQPVNQESRQMYDVWVHPSEVLSFYERHPELYREKEEVFVQGIFIRFQDHRSPSGSLSEAEDKAKEFAAGLAERARSGEDFEALVREVHGEPLDIFREPFGRKDRRPEFVETFAWKAKEGDISDPIRTRFGYVVLKLVYHHPERVQPFDEVKQQIEQRFLGLKLQEADLKIKAQLLKTSVVTPERFRVRLEQGLAQAQQAFREELAR